MGTFFFTVVGHFKVNQVSRNCDKDFVEILLSFIFSFDVIETILKPKQF